MKKFAILAILLMIVGAGGMAAQKFAFGDELPSYTKKWTFSPGELKELVINSSSASIEAEFIQSQNGSNYVELSGNTNQNVIHKLDQVSVNGGRLEVDLSNDSEFRFFNVNFQSYKQHMTVALSDPAELAKVEANLDSADVEFKGTQADQIHISASSGVIKLSSVQAKTLKASVDSGIIKAEKVQADVALSAESGNLELDHWVGNGSLKTSSGSIRIQDQQATQLDLEADSGMIEVEANPNFKGFYDAQAESGVVEVPDSPRTTTDVIKARVDSGIISIGE
ncbi:DUF4097 family beta strand repeat-containing protein [Paenibacillus sp. YPG26]|uniref:DUF4097 family beta strand repeat-containing protein n=1 Tax=Paenibacillus sp. YPG26 TaxID=2878915 RepID=UPI002041EE67|nr:DUF4097 family beta strand repeat-containing protein [Paenibacillus sp. YPG26]USB32950.1 DUF4097 domain-containing protein [Paenibacillus sp. YPG26]